MLQRSDRQDGLSVRILHFIWRIQENEQVVDAHISVEKYSFSSCSSLCFMEWNRVRYEMSARYDLLE